MRLIDADALIKKIFPYDVVDKKAYSINAKMIHEAIKEAPTVDIKTEVAREIFAEIDSMCIDTFGNFNYRRYIELKNKYIGGVGE